MFRIFLRKKLYSRVNAKPGPGTKRGLNKRLYERYTVYQQHLTVLNEQDILLIRDISAQGFCSDVSTRAFERFQIGDIYAARMRNHGDIQDIKMKVAWKRNVQVGFEIYQPDEKTLNFFRNLLRPIELAHSLSQVDAAFMRDQYAGLTWFHGEDADLYVWTDEDQTLSAWQLIFDENSVEWRLSEGFKTGEMQKQIRTELGILEPSEYQRKMDSSPDQRRLRLASDVIAALPFIERTELLKTLDELA